MPVSRAMARPTRMGRQMLSRMCVSLRGGGGVTLTGSKGLGSMPRSWFCLLGEEKSERMTVLRNGEGAGRREMSPDKMVYSTSGGVFPRSLRGPVDARAIDVECSVDGLKEGITDLQVATACFGEEVGRVRVRGGGSS